MLKEAAGRFEPLAAVAEPHLRLLPRVVVVGRIFVALALVGLGVEHVIFGQFVTGRAPAWPEAAPGGTTWANLTGVAFVAAAVAMLSGRHARSAAIAAALLVFGWALLRHVPVLLGETLLSGAWTRAGKALALTGGLLAVAATFPRSSTARATPLQRRINLQRRFIDAGRWCLGLFLA